MPTPHGTERLLKIDAGNAEQIPAILQLPTSNPVAPAVLLVHGFNSEKERMANSIGAALLRHGIASLAIDLPLHGRRKGSVQDLSYNNPLGLISTWKLALHEITAALDFLAMRPTVDANRLAVAGYSLGSYLSLFLAANDKRVRAVALAAGGDLPQGLPMERVVRAAVDPQKAVRALNGRPLLMINGSGDRTIRPEWAKSLFEAAGEPKELRWYTGGHWPPVTVINDISDWLAASLKP